MLCSSWLHKHVKLVHCHSIEVLDGRRHKKAAAYDDAIAMPRWSRCKLIVIHEVCHILIKRIHGRNGVAAHGREYAKLFAELIQHFMSVEDAEQLRAAFKRNKVKYSLPRVPQIFKEKREMPQAAIEALKKWRETKSAERKTI